jgi:hypothetical protein
VRGTEGKRRGKRGDHARGWDRNGKIEREIERDRKNEGKHVERR